MKVKMFHTPTSARIGARFKAASVGIPKGMEALQERQLREMEAEAKRLTGHRAYKLGSVRPGPYGYNNGPGPTEDYEANQQTGKMHRGWKTSRRHGANQSTYTLYNTENHSRFFAGNPTSRMRARPLLQKLTDNHGKRVTEGRIHYERLGKEFLGDD